MASHQKNNTTTETMTPPSPAAARSIQEMTKPFAGLFPPKSNNGSQSYNCNQEDNNNNITNKSTMMMQSEKKLRKPPCRKQRNEKHKTHKTRMVANKKQQQQRQYLKFHSSSCEVGSDFHRRTQTTFNKIDPLAGAQKIYQRQKQIEKGKNTVGYDEYRRRVPFDERIPKSMDTPSTPDHTLDIPNRKWNGMVKAWRIALHKYDPKDLQDAFQEAQSAKKQYGEFNNGRNTHNSGDYGDLNDFRNELIDRLDDGSISRQRALAEAHEQGLLDLVVVDDAKKKERIRRFDGQRPERETASTAPSSLSSPSTRSTSTEAAGSSSFFPVTAASANKVTPSSSQLLSSRLVASGTGREETHQHVVGSKEEEFFDFDGNSFMSEGDMSDDDEDDDLL